MRKKNNRIKSDIQRETRRGDLLKIRKNNFSQQTNKHLLIMIRMLKFLMTSHDFNKINVKNEDLRVFIIRTR